MKIVMPKLVLILLFLVCDLFAQRNSEQSGKVELPHRGICAHRGASHTHPENTISAFKEAIRLGVHMIEFDVRLTKDGFPIIIHDSSVDRTTNGSGLVNDLTLQEIKNLDCGSWKSSEFKDSRIPTLEEALEIMPYNIWLNIHLKGGERLASIVTKLVIDVNREHQSVLACNKEAAKGARSVSSKIILCNMERQENRNIYVEETIIGDFNFIQLLNQRDSEDITEEIALLEKNMIKINYYGTRSYDEMIKLFNEGIDFILVDDPSIVKSLKNVGISPMQYD